MKRVKKLNRKFLDFKVFMKKGWYKSQTKILKRNLIQLKSSTLTAQIKRLPFLFFLKTISNVFQQPYRFKKCGEVIESGKMLILIKRH